MRTTVEVKFLYKTGDILTGELTNPYRIVDQDILVEALDEDDPKVVVTLVSPNLNIHMLVVEPQSIASMREIAI